MLDKLNIEDIKPSSRKYPGIVFKPEREAGDQVLTVNGLSMSNEEGDQIFDNLSFTTNKGDKIAFISKDPMALTLFFKAIGGDLKPDKGDINWGVTIQHSYLPNDNSSFFETKLSLVDWLRQYSEEKDETFIRGFLGRMLFSGEESLKSANVLSGGEKVRCMLSKLMLESPNLLILDEPINHLDLESIQAFNNELVEYPGTVLFHSHDHEFINTVANRIIELTPKGVIDKMCTYDEYLADPSVPERRAEMLS